MLKYVVGLVFSRDYSDILLIRKNRPAWQAGQWNGLGGKIEEWDYPPPAVPTMDMTYVRDWQAATAAVRRECLEEAGIDCPSWRRIACVPINGVVIFFLATTHNLGAAKSMTDEDVSVVAVRDTPFNIKIPLVHNLDWLIPLARHESLDLPIVVCDNGDPAGT